MEKINMSRFGNCNEHYRFYTMESISLAERLMSGSMPTARMKGRT